MSSAQTPLFNAIAGLYQRYAEITDEVYRPYLERALPAGGARPLCPGLGPPPLPPPAAHARAPPRATRERRVDAAARAREPPRALPSRPTRGHGWGRLLGVTADAEGAFDLVLSVNTLFHLFGQHGSDRVLRHVRSLVAP